MQLGKTYINQTAELNPRPSFVPWVMVNNQPLGEVSTSPVSLTFSFTRT